MEQLNIPKSWDDISYKLYMELRELDNEEFQNNYLKSASIISILLDVDDEYLDDYDMDEISELFKTINFIYKEPSTKFKTQIDKYYFKSFDIFTFGEFLDVDYFVSNGIEENLPKIASILYRQQSKTKWGNIEWEPYGEINLNERMNEFIEQPITSYYGIIQSFLEWKKNFMEIYQMAFEAEIDDPDDDSELTEEDLIQERKEKDMAKFSWQLLIDKLTDGDITKIDAITDLPLIQVFNNLIMLKVKNNLKVNQ